MRIARSFIFSVLCLGFAVAADGALVFFPNNAAGFAIAMSGSTLIGVENFEGSTLTPGAIVGFNDPLTQGVANGPYPAGLTQPITVQSNLSGGAPTNPNPRGVNGLAALSAGAAGNVSDIVTTNFVADSLDWIFAPADGITGVGLNPLSLLPTGTLEIRVFGTSNNLLGTTTIAGDAAGTNFLGIQATGGDLIGRINFFSLVNGVEGGDNAQLFREGRVVGGVIPEPASLTIWALGAIGCAVGAYRHRKRA